MPPGRVAPDIRMLCSYAGSSHLPATSLGCRPVGCALSGRAARPADPALRLPKLPSFSSPPRRRAAGLVTEALAGRRAAPAGVAPLGLPRRTARRGRSEPRLVPPPWPGRELSREAGRLPCSDINPVWLAPVLACIKLLRDLESSSKC